METHVAAIVTNNVVEGVIVIEPCEIPAIREAYGYEKLIAVDDSVQIGDTYDAEKSVFFRDGVRIYPEKTDSEKIAALEQELNDVQLANAERFAAIEDALCEIDMGGTV